MYLIKDITFHLMAYCDNLALLHTLTDIIFCRNKPLNESDILD